MRLVLGRKKKIGWDRGSTFSAGVGVDGPYQDTFRGGVREVGDYAEDVH